MRDVFEFGKAGCLRRALEDAGVPLSRLQLFEREYYRSLARYQRRDRMGTFGGISFRSQMSATTARTRTDESRPPSASGQGTGPRALDQEMP